MTQQATEQQASRMVDAAEARRQLGIGKTKFYALVRTGELHVHDISPNKPGLRRVGEKGHRRVLRVAQAEIDRYLAATAISA